MSTLNVVCSSVLVNLGDFNKWWTFSTLFDVLWSTDLDIAGIRFQKFQQTENWFSQPSCGYIHIEAWLTQCLFYIALWHQVMTSMHAEKKVKKKKTIKSRPSSFLLRSARTNLMESLFLSLQLNRIEENYSPSSSNEQRKPELSREICKHTKFQSCSRCYHWAISMWLSVNQW